MRAESDRRYEFNPGDVTVAVTVSDAEPDVKPVVIEVPEDDVGTVAAYLNDDPLEVAPSATRYRRALLELLRQAPAIEPAYPEGDDGEAQEGWGLEQGAWEAGRVARRALRGDDPAGLERSAEAKLTEALGLLRVVRDLVKEADSPKTLARVRGCINSLEGARRYQKTRDAEERRFPVARHE
jgi:hypothetical protein